MVSCVFRHFIAKLEDQELRPILEYARQQSQDHVRVINDIFEEEKFPIPVGFTDNDVNINAPRLFTDVFVAMYIRHMAIIGMGAGAAAVGMCARSDVSVFFAEVVAGALELHDRSRRLLLEKGIYTRPPSLSIPDRVEFVSKESFLTGFLVRSVRLPQWRLHTYSTIPKLIRWVKP